MDEIGTEALTYNTGLCCAAMQANPVDQCIKACKALEYRYAGLKGKGNAGKWCWCGGYIDKNDAYNNDRTCDSPCGSGDGAYCGGEKSWSVWRDPTSPDVPEDAAKGYKVMRPSGCMKFPSWAGWENCPDATGENLSTEKCMSCCGAKGLAYAATSHRANCWCAASISKAVTDANAGTNMLPITACNYPCSASTVLNAQGKVLPEDTQYCGAWNGAAALPYGNVYYNEELDTWQKCGMGEDRRLKGMGGRGTPKGGDRGSKQKPMDDEDEDDKRRPKKGKGENEDDEDEDNKNKGPNKGKGNPPKGKGKPDEDDEDEDNKNKGPNKGKGNPPKGKGKPDEDDEDEDNKNKGPNKGKGNPPKGKGKPDEDDEDEDNKNKGPNKGKGNPPKGKGKPDEDDEDEDNKNKGPNKGKGNQPKGNQPKGKGKPDEDDEDKNKGPNKGKGKPDEDEEDEDNKNKGPNKGKGNQPKGNQPKGKGKPDEDDEDKNKGPNKGKGKPDEDEEDEDKNKGPKNKGGPPRGKGGKNDEDEDEDNNGPDNNPTRTFCFPPTQGLLEGCPVPVLGLKPPVVSCQNNKNSFKQFPFKLFAAPGAKCPKDYQATTHDLWRACTNAALEQYNTCVAKGGNKKKPCCEHQKKANLDSIRDKNKFQKHINMHCKGFGRKPKSSNPDNGYMRL
ncbi:hypothetical protein Dda_1230 [Drechslerella dactyloides]|uniref:WSC domain-containing protein n=1 Tax=Drechslerella dactyloides TaxID=74499 RepID=A0AAD6NNZ2_DREDA|nr:hypothetical protein Dda_1230 [Drechslerella dactyloides]